MEAPSRDAFSSAALTRSSCSFSPEYNGLWSMLGPSDLLDFVMHVTDSPPHQQCDEATVIAKSITGDCSPQMCQTSSEAPQRGFVEAHSAEVPLMSSTYPPSTTDDSSSRLIPSLLSPCYHVTTSETTRSAAKLPLTHVSRILEVPGKSFDGTCRSTFSLLSSNNFGTITTASSTPSHVSEMPSWSQDTTALRPSKTLANQSLGYWPEATRSRSSSCGSPTHGQADELELSDIMASIRADSTGETAPLFSSSRLSPPTCFREFNGDGICSQSDTSSLSQQHRTSSSGITTRNNLTHRPSAFSNNGGITARAGPVCAPTSRPYEEEDSAGASSFSGNRLNLRPPDQQHSDSSWQCCAVHNDAIPKGLTDFYALTFASKRWQNLNVVFPLFVPHGTIAVLRATGENTYVFPDTYPGAQLLLSGAGRICDIWATYLRLRVAVIHKCPEFLVPKLAQVFNKKLADLPKFAEPITLSCSGLVKHTIQLRSSGGLTYRYDTIGQLVRPEDQMKMQAVFSALQNVLTAVNHNLAHEVEQILEQLHRRSSGQGMGEHTYRGPPRCGLEFRFSPCKELKIAIREGTPCNCIGVDSLIAGGGSSSMSAWAQQFSTEPIIIGEVRLERDKTSETQLDPFFLPEHEIKTRMITKDLDGMSARATFVDPAFYPCYYRPQVQYAINTTPLEAAHTLCGATHTNLAKLLPNGMASLTAFNADANCAVSMPSATESFYHPKDHYQTPAQYNETVVTRATSESVELQPGPTKWLGFLESMTAAAMQQSSSSPRPPLLLARPPHTPPPPTSPCHAREAVGRTIAALNASAAGLPPEATRLLSQLQAVLEKVQQHPQAPPTPSYPLSTEEHSTVAPPYFVATTSLDSTADLRTESDASTTHAGECPTSKSAGATPAHHAVRTHDDPQRWLRLKAADTTVSTLEGRLAAGTSNGDEVHAEGGGSDCGGFLT